MAHQAGHADTAVAGRGSLRFHHPGAEIFITTKQTVWAEKNSCAPTLWGKHRNGVKKIQMRQVIHINTHYLFLNRRKIEYFSRI